MALICLSFYLVINFALGGSSRGDEPAVLLLRPLSVIALLAAVYLAHGSHIRQNLFVTCWVAAIVLVTCFHLVPLPPALWRQIAGQDLIAQIHGQLNTAPSWRPLSVSPELTRNALWSLLGPVACFLLAIRLSNREMFWALCLIIGLGLLSGVFSAIQISQGPESPFYLYKVTSRGIGVGLFANRNHQAVMLSCLLPISFGLLLVSDYNGRMSSAVRSSSFAAWAMAVNSIFVVILILVTGSRAGLGVSFVSLVLLYFLARQYAALLANRRGLSKSDLASAKNFINNKALLVFVPIGICIAAAATMLSGRDAALQRLVATGIETESRYSIVDTLREMIGANFLVGSGIGTFEATYRLHERSELLTPKYWNHAHNDWAEIVLTGGLPVIILVAVGIGWVFKAYVIERKEKPKDVEAAIFGLVGLCVISLMLLSSIVEYPLRAPILSCLFGIALALISRAKSVIKS